MGWADRKKMFGKVKKVVWVDKKIYCKSCGFRNAIGASVGDIKCLLEKFEEINSDYSLRRYLEKGINEDEINKNYLYRIEKS